MALASGEGGDGDFGRAPRAESRRAVGVAPLRARDDRRRPWRGIACARRGEGAVSSEDRRPNMRSVRSKTRGGRSSRNLASTASSPANLGLICNGTSTRRRAKRAQAVDRDRRRTDERARRRVARCDDRRRGTDALGRADGAPPSALFTRHTKIGDLGLIPSGVARAADRCCQRILSADAIAHSVPRPPSHRHPRWRQRSPAEREEFGVLYASAWLDERTLVVAGGGGKKSSGIPNRMCVATFDGVTLSEPLFSCHTDETAPQGLIPTPDKTRLLCVFSGDVALYDVAPNPDPGHSRRHGGVRSARPPAPPSCRARSSPRTPSPTASPIASLSPTATSSARRSARTASGSPSRSRGRRPCARGDAPPRRTSTSKSSPRSVSTQTPSPASRSPPTIP